MSFVCASPVTISIGVKKTFSCNLFYFPSFSCRSHSFFPYSGVGKHLVPSLIVLPLSEYCNGSRIKLQGFSKVAFVQRLCLCMLLFCSFLRFLPCLRQGKKRKKLQKIFAVATGDRA